MPLSELENKKLLKISLVTEGITKEVRLEDFNLMHCNAACSNSFISSKTH